MQRKSVGGISLSTENRAALERAFGIDTRSLALFRVTLAALVIVDVLLRLPDLTAHYTDVGILPRHAVDLFQSAPWNWSIYFLHGGGALPAVLLAITLAFSVMLLFGYRTRLAAIALWFLVVSLHARNPMLLNRGDETLRVLLFWSMFLPLGVRWSVDRALASNPARLPKVVLSFGSAGMLLQVASIYLFTWLLKTGPSWRDGTAIELALQVDRHTWPTAEYLLALPAILPPLTHGVFWFELLGPLLLFVPVATLRLRLVLVPAFVLMHLGFALFIVMGLFPLFSLLSLVLFVPPLAWDAWGALKRGGEGLSIYYDGGCSFCRKVVSLLETFLVLPKVVVLEAQSDPATEAVMLEQNSWVVVDATGDLHTRGDGLRSVVKASPLFGFLHHLWRCRQFATVVDRAYKWVAANRPTARRTAQLFPSRPLQERAPAAVQAVAAVLIFYVATWNVAGVIGWRPPLPVVAHSLQVQQYWSMFAPAPTGHSTWVVMSGETVDGRKVDLFGGLKGSTLADASDALPKSYQAAFLNYRWLRYIEKLEFAPSVADPLAAYLCRLAPSNWGVSLERANVAFIVPSVDAPGVPLWARWTHDLECSSGGLASGV